MFHYCRHLLNGVEAELMERNAARLNKTTSALARPTWDLIDADYAPVAKKGKSSHDRATIDTRLTLASFAQEATN
jgi:hypothetical protein